MSYEDREAWKVAYFKSMSHDECNRYWTAREAEQQQRAAVIGWMALAGFTIAFVVVFIERLFKGTP